MKKILLIFILFSSPFLCKVKAQNCQFLCNGDFENPVIGHWTLIPDTVFQCWKTTESDSLIELWWTGFNGVPAYHGNQFVELNANAVGTLFQNFLIAPNTNVTIGFAHRGRAGVDTMSVSIGPVGGPYTTIGIYGDSNTAWGYYTVAYTIPSSLGNYYSLRFNSIYATGGNPTVGNFLDDISVNIYPQLGTTTSFTDLPCFNGADGSASVTVSTGLAPYTYLWSPGGQTTNTITGLSAGMYTCLVNDANGCSVIDTVNITQPSSGLTATIPAITSVLCNGANTGTATVNVSGGTGPYTYLWSPGGGTTATISNLSAGTYTAVVRDASGCSATDTITLTQSPLMNSSIPSSTNVICFGGNTGSASASATGGLAPYTYLWSPGGETTAFVSGLSAGTYTVTVEGNNGCSSSATVTLTQAAQINCNAAASMDVACYGGSTGSAIATGSGGQSPYTYNWSSGGGTTSSVSNLSAGTYTVTIEDANGCSASATATITQASLLKCTIQGSTDILCNGGDSSGSATAGGNGGVGPYTYKWTPGGQTTATASNLSAGSYTVTVYDANGCTGSNRITIKMLPPALYACCNKIISLGGSDTIIADSAVRYKWIPSTGLNCDTCKTVIASPTVTTTYTVTGTDANGCTVDRVVTVTMENLCADFTVPNVFTPNGDGVNDQLVIKAEDMDKYSILIYDRWGKEMYTSTDANTYWNGNTEGGEEASAGVYYYIITATCQQNNYKKEGFVQLIR